MHSISPTRSHEEPFFKGSYLDWVPGGRRTPDSDYVTVGFAVGDVVFAR